MSADTMSLDGTNRGGRSRAGRRPACPDTAAQRAHTGLHRQPEIAYRAAREKPVERSEREYRHLFFVMMPRRYGDDSDPRTGGIDERKPETRRFRSHPIGSTLVAYDTAEQVGAAWIAVLFCIA